MKWLDRNRPLVPALDDMACAVSSSFFSDATHRPRNLLDQISNADREKRWRARLDVAVLKDKITEDEITQKLKHAYVLRRILIDRQDRNVVLLKVVK